MGLFWSKFESIFKTSSFSKYAQTNLSLDPGIPGPGTFFEPYNYFLKVRSKQFFLLSKMEY